MKRIENEIVFKAIFEPGKQKIKLKALNLKL